MNIKHMKFGELIKRLSQPDYQRVVDSNHTNYLYDMIETAYKNKEPYQYECIQVWCDKTLNPATAPLIIVDGQHRVNAYKRLCDTFKTDIEIDVNIHHCEKSKAFEIFTKLNMRKPIEIFDKEDIQVTMNSFIKWIKCEWSGYIKTTDSPQLPGFNLDKILKAINDSKVISEYNLDAKKLEQMFNALNYHLKTKIMNNTFALSVAVRNKFASAYNGNTPIPEFGLIPPDKLVEVIKFLAKGGKMSDFDPNFLNKKIRGTLLKKVKDEVYKTYVSGAMNEGPCYVCGATINYSNAVYAHVIPVCFGGDTNAYNLRPTCAHCNTEMGVENLEAYKKRIV